MTETTTILRQERLRRGWSQLHVCRIATMSPSDLSRVERGLMPVFPAWRRRLSHAFGVSESFLFPSGDDGEVQRVARPIAS